MRRFPLRLLTVTYAIASIVGAQYVYDAVKMKRPDPAVFVLPIEVVKSVDLGLHSAAASLIWLYTIQGSGHERGPKLPDDVRLIHALDERFTYPYGFAILFLPAIKLLDEAIALGEEGTARIQDDWRIPYYVAVTYHTYKKDTINAAKFFSIAASRPLAPPEVRGVAVSYGGASSRREKTRAVWKAIFENSRDYEAKERIANLLIHLDLLDLLDRAAVEYRRRTGVFPKNVEEIVALGILPESLPNPLELEYIFDGEGRARTKSAFGE